MKMKSKKNPETKQKASMVLRCNWAYVKRIRQAKKQEEADLFVCIEKYVVAEEPTHAEDRFQSEYKWSSMDLPSPPLFNGKHFDIWSSRMRVNLQYVDTHVDVNDEARDALALHLIQQALDESILHKVASTKTSKEAWSVLEEKFSERGSSEDETEIAVENEAAENVEEKFEGSASQAEHSESHNAVKHVDDGAEFNAAIVAVVEDVASQVVAGESALAEVEDISANEFADEMTELDDDSVDEEAASRAVLEEEVAIAATENDIATQEVAGQPSEAECVDEKLMKSKPKREEVFLNNLFVCEFAGIENNQLAIGSNEEQRAQRKFDEEILSDEESQKLKEEMKLIADFWNGRVDEFENSVEESSIEAAEMTENLHNDGSHIAARTEKESIDGWLEEPICYDEDDSLIAAVEPAEAKEMNEQFETIYDDGRTRLKGLEEIWKKKAKMKKRKKKTSKKNRAKKKLTRRVPEFRIWSSKKKKKLH